MKYLLPILLLSVAVRLALPPDPTAYAAMQSDYSVMATSLRSGRGYAMADGTRPIMYYLPGYSLLVSIIGDATIVLQKIADGVLGPLLLWLALCRQGFRRAAYAAALLYALALPVAFLTGWTMPDSLTTLWSLAIAMPLLIWTDRQGAAVSGLMLGIAGWFRGEFLALLPLLALFLLVRRQWHSTALFALSWAIPALALTVFLHAHYGLWTLTRPGIGLDAYEGIGEYANPCGITARDEAAGRVDETHGLHYGTPEGDALLMREYFACTQKAPLVIVGQALQRFWRTVTLAEADWYGLRPPGLVIGGGLLLALLGFWRQRRTAVAWVFVVLWISRAGPFSLIYSQGRWVVPLLAVYIVGISLLFERRIRR